TSTISVCAEVPCSHNLGSNQFSRSGPIYRVAFANEYTIEEPLQWPLYRFDACRPYGLHRLDLGQFGVKSANRFPSGCVHAFLKYSVASQNRAPIAEIPLMNERLRPRLSDSAGI